jgi:hypothetical protein
MGMFRVYFQWRPDGRESGKASERAKKDHSYAYLQFVKSDIFSAHHRSGDCHRHGSSGRRSGSNLIDPVERGGLLSLKIPRDSAEHFGHVESSIETPRNRRRGGLLRTV